MVFTLTKLYLSNVSPVVGRIFSFFSTHVDQSYGTCLYLYMLQTKCFWMDISKWGEVSGPFRSQYSLAAWDGLCDSRHFKFHFRLMCYFSSFLILNINSLHWIHEWQVQAYSNINNATLFTQRNVFNQLWNNTSCIVLFYKTAKSQRSYSVFFSMTFLLGKLILGQFLFYIILL